MIKFGNTYLKFGDTYLSGYKVPTYNVILQQSTGGTINAIPLSGHRNTEVTLSNTPNTDYIFNGYEISGSNLYNTNKFKFEESDVTVHAKWYKKPDPYNPLNLPPNTVRVRTRDGNVPKKTGAADDARYETATLVPGTSDVYDVYKSGTNFHNLLYKSNNVIEVLGANTSNITDMYAMFDYCDSLTNVALFDTSKVTNMYSMFRNCTSLTTVPLFDTSNVTDMDAMFSGCTALQSVPLFNTSKVTNMSYMFSYCEHLTTVPLFDTSMVTYMHYMFDNCIALQYVPLFNTSKVREMACMFYYCINVQSGALALYRQASTQANPPSGHGKTFRNCGSNTQTGAAELAQIPSNWK